ncbi:MAG: Rap1a/Tai family immunity protein [Desulfobacterales bacterium]|nr:Rap1a/Tai family immunity protein [Desulfobacterales bacterium]
MRKRIISLALIILFWLPIMASAVSEKDFEVNTTKNIINLCTASSDDPLYHQAINFCHGYLVGAFHYYEAHTSGPSAIKFVCPPDQRPSRNESIGRFIEWAQARPQYHNETPVETEFRFLMEYWPCK